MRARIGDMRGDGDGVLAGLGCLVFLVWAAFWIAVLVIAVHFVQKFW